MEIHHIDGIKTNNEIDNLLLVTIQEHYDIHFRRNDWAACLRITGRMNIDPAVKSYLATMSNQKRLANGNHPFIDSKIRMKVQNTIKNRINNGTFHLLSENFKKEWSDKAIETYNKNHNRSEVVKRTWDVIDYNDRLIRTSPGTIAASLKTKGTKWYHDLDGNHIRVHNSDPILSDPRWIKGRFKNKNKKGINE